MFQQKHVDCMWINLKYELHMQAFANVTTHIVL